jgi:hypothetical protein
MSRPILQLNRKDQKTRSQKNQFQKDEKCDRRKDLKKD